MWADFVTEQGLNETERVPAMIDHHGAWVRKVTPKSVDASHFRTPKAIYDRLSEYKKEHPGETWAPEVGLANGKPA